MQYTELCLIDASTLNFEWVDTEHSQLRLLSADQQELARIDTPTLQEAITQVEQAVKALPGNIDVDDATTYSVEAQAAMSTENKSAVAQWQRAEMALTNENSRAAFEVMDEASDTGRIWNGVKYYPVCIYNPYTAQLSLGRAEEGQVFTALDTVPLDRTGTLATLVEEEEGRVIRLRGTVSMTTPDGTTKSVVKFFEFYENEPLTIEAAARQLRAHQIQDQ